MAGAPAPGSAQVQAQPFADPDPFYDIENAVWRNVDGVWTRLLRYRSAVERDVAVHSVPEKFGRIEYTRSIVGIGDPEDGWLIAPQLHLMRLESLSGDADLG